MALRDVGTFYFALFEGGDLWHHRLCLGHSLRCAVIASPHGDVCEVLWSDYASFLLAGPRGGPPDALLWRMLHRFRAEDMKTDSPFWNIVQREAAALPLVASRDADTALDRTTTVPTGLTFESAPVGSRWHALEDTTGFKARDDILFEPGDISSHVDNGYWSLVDIISLLHHQAWRLCTLTLRRRMCAEEHALHDFPIQGPRTTHWLLLDGTTGGDEQWCCHHRILELTSTSPYVNCLATARSMTISIVRTWCVITTASTVGGWHCRETARPRLVVFRRDMPRNDTFSLAELDKKKRSHNSKNRKWVASQLAKEAAIFKERRKGREERELVAAASDSGGQKHRKPK